MQAAVVRLNADRCLEVLWVPGHCGLRGNELTDEEAKLGSAEHQLSVVLDRATMSPDKTRLHFNLQHHAARSPIQQEDVLLSKSETTDLRRFRSGHHPALR